MFSLARGCDRLAKSLNSLNRDLLSSSSQRGSDYNDLPMFTHMQGTCITPREKLFKLLLIKMNDQIFSSRPKGLNITLRRLILNSGE